jgi:hypothetical protein
MCCGAVAAAAGMQQLWSNAILDPSLLTILRNTTVLQQITAILLLLTLPRVYNTYTQSAYPCKHSSAKHFFQSAQSYNFGYISHYVGLWQGVSHHPLWCVLICIASRPHLHLLICTAIVAPLLPSSSRRRYLCHHAAAAFLAAWQLLPSSPRGRRCLPAFLVTRLSTLLDKERSVPPPAGPSVIPPVVTLAVAVVGGRRHGQQNGVMIRRTLQLSASSCGVGTGQEETRRPQHAGISTQ